MGRQVLAVVAGVIIAGLVVASGELVGFFLFPPPPGMLSGDREQMRTAIEHLHPGSFASVLIAHALGSFLGGYTAAYLSKQAQLTSGIIVGALLLLAGIMNLVQIPHPAWFAIVDSLLYIPLAYVGARVGEHL